MSPCMTAKTSPLPETEFLEFDSNNNQLSPNEKNAPLFNGIICITDYTGGQLSFSFCIPHRQTIEVVRN